MRFPIAVYIFLGLFVIASIIQLIFAFTENQKVRKKEKFLCMLFLGLAAIMACPKEPLIYVAAFLGMIGDIFVTRSKTFVTGVVAFFLGHICYIVETIWKAIGFNNISIILYISFLLTYALTFLIVYLICKRNKTHKKFDIVGQALYFAILVTYIPVFIVAIVKTGELIYLSLIGSVLFIASDTILVITHFGRKFKRYDFYIMIPYLIAEFLIISGLVLTLI